MVDLEDIKKIVFVTRKMTGLEAKKVREYLGLTQEQLAKKMAVSRKAVNGWETGAAVITPQQDYILHTFAVLRSPALFLLSRVRS